VTPVNLTDLLVGLVIAVGLVGIVLPVLPGSVLILGAVLVWAVLEGSGAAWAVFAVVTLLVVTGGVVKYVVPGRSLRAAGVPTRTLVLGGLLGIVGFFVIPVLGLPLGFVGGVYAAELSRLGGERAWPSTKSAVRAVGVSILIELAAALLAAAVWLFGAIAL
jgi:uncharacterized protein YqgC (DUF456 family)